MRRLRTAEERGRGLRGDYTKPTAIRSKEQRFLRAVR